MRTSRDVGETGNLDGFDALDSVLTTCQAFSTTADTTTPGGGEERLSSLPLPAGLSGDEYSSKAVAAGVG